MIHKPGAQTRYFQVGPAAGWIWRLGTEVRVEVFVVCLEQAQAKMAAQERQGVIHTAADGQRRAVGVGLMVGATQPYKTGICVDKRGDLRRRVAEYHTELAGRGSVIVAIGMIRVFNLSTHVAVEVVGNASNRAVVDGRVRDRATDTNIGTARDRNRAVRRQVRVTCKNVDSRSRRVCRSDRLCGCTWGAELDES